MSTTNLSPHFKGLGQWITRGGSGNPGTGAKNQSGQGKYPGPLQGVAEGPSPCSGSPARGAHRPEGRGDSQSPSTLTFLTGHPKARGASQPHWTWYTWGVEESFPLRGTTSYGWCWKLRGRYNQTPTPWKGPKGPGKVQGAKSPGCLFGQSPTG